MKRAFLIALVVLAACGPVRKRGSGKITLAVLPAESAKFPGAAQAITESLSEASVTGVDDKQVASVSLEVAQLSIECVEHNVVCYTKVGHTLDADRLLFAQIQSAGKKGVEVTVTLFDVDARKPRSVRRVYVTEAEAIAKSGALVSEVAK